MSNERRFSEKEIARIFEYAAREQEKADQQRSGHEGLSLGELQKIGESSGINPEFIARAASMVDSIPVIQPVESYFGFPAGVGRSVELPGTLSEEDWGRLVIDLRETFGARGKVEQNGLLRHWSNGNLQALIEPTDSGYRLRLKTFKGEVKTLSWMGAFYLVGALLLSALLFFDGDVEPGNFVITLMVLAIGLFPFILMAIRQPGWARKREAQMDAIIARAVERSNQAVAPNKEDARTEQISTVLDLDVEPDATDRTNGNVGRQRTH